MMILLRKSVGFIADVLQEPQGVGVAAEAEGFFGAGDEDLFFALGERDHGRRGDAQFA